MPEVRNLWQTEELFSDHYLKARLDKNDWWPTDDEAKPLWEFCKALYEKRYLACARNNEAFTRQELLDKILEKLGFPYTDNLGLPETQQDLEPDYILYPDAETKEKVIDRSAAERYRAAVAILEAKKLHHPLSQLSKHQQRYPHQQIRHYLNEAQMLSWGILTNGNEWRLYCRDSKPSHFFALNFEVAVKELADFKVFLALFSPAAFVRDAQGKCRLDQVRESALAAQAKLEEDLRQRVFTLVEILANGFVERPENHIGDTDEDRSKLYENCLIFLYRLLFILYAEGRNLLPVEPKSRKFYKDLSLARLINPLKNFSEFDSRTRTRLYQDIQELCHLINGTDEKKNKEYSVPRYNGGLFDADKYSALERWRVCDAVLADVLRGLLFNPLPDPQQPTLPIETVDFGDLRVQQLGSIYEGLLEHHFALENRRLTLKTDKAERKATGTYYTPDYIVKYIVEQTVAPLLAEIESRETVKTSRAAGKQDNSFANEVLKLNLCDPAMGSGHFLVEATTYLADQIVYHPTTKFQAEFVKGKSQEESEIAYWRRRVVEACIYEVDLNPLAVELAKLSLWLTTISTDQPLNFLDHHLRCGNSLIGARLEDLSHVPDSKVKSADRLKLSWKITENLRASLTRAVQMVHKIEGAASASVGDVKNKEKLWLESVRPALLPFRTVANLWIACFFGNELPQNDYEALIELLDIHPDKIRPWQNAAEFQSIVMEAVKKGSLKLAGREFDTNQLKNLCAFLFRSERSAAERRFFHWELEFPEVFFNDDGTPRESPGFEAVVGNPPYSLLQPQNIDADSLRLFQRFEVAHYKIDIYHLFISHGIDLLRERGFLGFITPAPFLMNNYTVNLGKYLLERCAIKRLVVIPDGVFPEASVDNVVFIFERSANESTRGHSEIQHAIVPANVPFEKATWHSMLQRAIKRSGECLIVLRQSEIIEPRSETVPLSELATVNFGMQLRDRSKFPQDVVETTDPTKLSRFHQPCWSGGSLGRYQLEFENLYAYVHEQARRGGCWDMTIHRAPEKIIVRQIGKQPICALDTTRQVCLNAVFMVVKSEPAARYATAYLLALLNSGFIGHFWRQNFSDYKQTFPKIKGTYLLRLPIRLIEFPTPEKKRAALLEEAKQLCLRSLADRNEDTVLLFVMEQLTAKPERSDVVHDLVAFLAEQMTSLNQEKRAAVKQFQTNLKDFHGIDAHVLKPKTKLDEFWRFEAAQVFAHFRANKIRLKVSALG